MTNIILRSIQHNHQITVNKSELIKLFPESLFALTLEQDSSAESIDLTNPVVTSDVLDAIKEMIRYGTTINLIPQEGWKQAGKYLLMNIFIAMADPLYLRLKPNLLSLTPIRFDEIMISCVAYDSYDMARYLMDRISCNSKKNWRSYNYAVSFGKVLPVQMLHKWGVKPTVDDLTIACANGYVELVRLLLNNPNIDPNRKKGIALKHAIHHGHIDIVKELLSHPRFDPTLEEAGQSILAVMNTREMVDVYVNRKGLDRFYHIAQISDMERRYEAIKEILSKIVD